VANHSNRATSGLYRNLDLTVVAEDADLAARLRGLGWERLAAECDDTVDRSDDAPRGATGDVFV
jgi:hypothetical protein